MYRLCILVVSLGTLAFLGCSGSSASQDDSSGLEVMGVVIQPDSAGSVLADARVCTEPMSDCAVTGKDGSFRITQGLQEGTYTVIAEHAAYPGTPGRTKIEVRPGNGRVWIMMNTTREYAPGELMERDPPKPQVGKSRVG